MAANYDLGVLEKYLSRVPGIKSSIAKGYFENGNWWVKFSIDITHHLAWQVIQELGYVLNYISVNERLPTVFVPVSPPPYMNGGPEDFLSWVIEAQDIEFTPSLCVEWLEGRLPRPVEDVEQWEQNR